MSCHSLYTRGKCDDAHRRYPTWNPGFGSPRNQSGKRLNRHALPHFIDRRLANFPWLPQANGPLLRRPCLYPGDEIHQRGCHGDDESYHARAPARPSEPRGRREECSRRLTGPAAALGLALAVGAAAPGIAGTTERVSVGPGGAQANGISSEATLSADGRFVAFSSFATNLIPIDTNGKQDVFLRDLVAGTTFRMSRAGAGQANGLSRTPSLSADGRLVAFESEASNLVQGDTNGELDVFVRDRKTNILSRVNRGPGGVQAIGGNSSDPKLSADGRFVAFFSEATNLVAGDTNAARDVFVRDRKEGVTTRVSVSSGGVQANKSSESLSLSLSADGRFVAFDSLATNLVPGDTNNRNDVFVHDRQTGKTVRASVGPGGIQLNASSGRSALSANGRFVALSSSATNLVPGDTNGVNDLFVRDLVTATITRVNVGPGGAQADLPMTSAFGSAISADGRSVVFSSEATTLVPADTNGHLDVFVRDRTGTIRVSVGPGGIQGQGSTGNGEALGISANGRVVAFSSGFTNLVPGDTNSLDDYSFTPDKQRRGWMAP